MIGIFERWLKEHPASEIVFEPSDCTFRAVRQDGAYVFAKADSLPELAVELKAKMQQPTEKPPEKRVVNVWYCEDCQNVEPATSPPYEPGDSEPCVFCEGTARVYAADDDKVRKPLIKKTHEEHECALCGSPMLLDSKHERDSSNDVHLCPICGWNYGEMETWGLE